MWCVLECVSVYVGCACVCMWVCVCWQQWDGKWQLHPHVYCFKPGGQTESLFRHVEILWTLWYDFYHWGVFPFFFSWMLTMNTWLHNYMRTYSVCVCVYMCDKWNRVQRRARGKTEWKIKTLEFFFFFFFSWIFVCGLVSDYCLNPCFSPPKSA